jgi:hypothetical protein
LGPINIAPVLFFPLNLTKEIEAIFNRSGLTANIEIKVLNIMLGLYGGEDLDVIFNTVIFISKIYFGRITVI